MNLWLKFRRNLAEWIYPRAICSSSPFVKEHLGSGLKYKDLKSLTEKLDENDGIYKRDAKGRIESLETVKTTKKVRNGKKNNRSANTRTRKASR